MRRLILLAAVLLLAATPAEVAPVVAAQGFFVESGTGADVARIGDAVAEARFAGGDLHVVVLAEEPAAGATVYAENVLDLLPRAEGTVLVVAPETIGWASERDRYSRDVLDRATTAALDAGDDTDAVERFVAVLTDGSAGGSGAGAGSGGGSPWVLIVVVLAVVGVVAYFAIRGARLQRRDAARRLAEARRAVGERIDALANDIIDLEDEITASGNEEAQARFQRATAVYGEAAERAAAAATPTALRALSARLDEAIWELDCAEAILDGRELPPRPTPPAVETATPPASGTAAAPVAAPTVAARRPGRRTESGTADLVNAILLGSLAMGGRRRGLPFPGGFGGGRATGRSVGGGRRIPRMLGGGRRRH